MILSKLSKQNFNEDIVKGLLWVMRCAVLLAVRIRKEEHALSENGGYSEALGPLPRFWPSLRARGAA